MTQTSIHIVGNEVEIDSDELIAMLEELPASASRDEVLAILHQAESGDLEGEGMLMTEEFGAKVAALLGELDAFLAVRDKVRKDALAIFTDRQLVEDTSPEAEGFYSQTAADFEEDHAAYVQDVQGSRGSPPASYDGPMNNPSKN